MISVDDRLATGWQATIDMFINSL